MVNLQYIVHTDIHRVSYNIYIYTPNICTYCIVLCIGCIGEVGEIQGVLQPLADTVWSQHQLQFLTKVCRPTIWTGVFQVIPRPFLP